MVAEPVSAALGALRSTYDSVSQFITVQTEKFPDPSTLWESTSLVYLRVPEFIPHVARRETFFEKLSHMLKTRKFESSCVILTGVGLAGLVYYRRKHTLALTALNSGRQRKRRTPKLPNGARRDVVLVIGSPTEPMTRLLVIDFEKRGFIVYLTILDDKDQHYVHSNSVTDELQYLDLCSSADYTADIARFKALLDVEVIPIPGSEPHFLKLSAVVFAPNLYFSLGPIENTSPASWEKVIARFTVYTCLFNRGLLDIVREHKSKVISIVPNIVSCLRLSYHATETVYQNCTKDLFLTLAKELKPQGISVTQIRLGNLNLASIRSLPASRVSKISRVIEAEVRSWTQDMQELYGKHFSRTQTRSNSGSTGPFIGSQGLRGLHHLLFDLIFKEGTNPAVVYYGAGARSYERVASFIPTALVELYS